MHTVWFGCGCFWSAEEAYGGVDGVLQTEVGFVATADHGKAEVVRVTFDPTRVDLDELLDVFVTIHDPSMPPTEPTERSLIGVLTPEDQARAVAALEQAARSGRTPGQPLTEIVLQPAYERAPDRHQGYLARERAAKEP